MIDEFLPSYDVTTNHEIVIRAAPDRVYAEIRALDFGRSWVIRQLLRLRGLPCRGITFDTLQLQRFAVLCDDPPREIILGLIGRFWTMSGELRSTNADDFPAFGESGYAKAVWNFLIREQSNGLVILSTETRVLCLDDASRKRFQAYWALVRPFSGWIRKEALRLVKRSAESV